jgi:hypothetical protein
MKPLFDAEALDEAITEVARDQLLREIHEWIVYTAPIGAQKIYKEYLAAIDRKQNDEMLDDIWKNK